MATETLTVRVYGFLFDRHKNLLLSDEYIRGGYFTKLPGGGLEIGEGTRDCLQREFKEETGIAVSIGDHIYTTDYYQKSLFRQYQQFIGIYYFVHALHPEKILTHEKKFDFDPDEIKDPQATAESRRWIPWEAVTEDTVNLPTDKIAIRILKEHPEWITHYFEAQ